MFTKARHFPCPEPDKSNPGRPYHFLTIHFSIILLTNHRTPKCPLPFGFPHQDPVRAIVLPHPCRKFGPSHSSAFDHPSNIWWRVKIINCLTLWEVAGILKTSVIINPLNTELNPICHLLALLGGATIVVFSRLWVKDEISVPCRPRPNAWHSCLEWRQHQVQNSAPILADANNGIGVSFCPSKQMRAVPRFRLRPLHLKSFSLSAM